MSVNYQTIPINEKVMALIQQDSSTLFDYEDVMPLKMKDNYRGLVPWGETNDLPLTIITNIRKSEVMCSNKHFNTLIGYGRGLVMNYPEEVDPDPAVQEFFRRNNSVKFLLEQMADQKHFYFSVALLVLSKDGKKIVRIRHKDAYHARFEANNPKTGKIENVFFAVWDDNPTSDEIQAYPLLDEDDPMLDLMVRMGREPDPNSGKKRDPSKERLFAIVTKFPTPGNKYYPFPAYASHFNSGWYDVASMIPLGKKAKMEHGMLIKFHVEIHKDYFNSLYKEENITDPDKKKARKALEFENIKSYLSGYEKAGKVWYSGFYIDANGKEVNMVKIKVIDNSKEGGDWIEDLDEVSSIQCYVDGTHPSLIGAVPGKNTGSMSGTDKRELFTIKQALEKPFRDLTLIPYQVIQEYNEWPKELTFEIPDMLITTLDKGTDAKPVILNPSEQ
jgi:hypothetical protein